VERARPKIAGGTIADGKRKGLKPDTFAVNTAGVVDLSVDLTI
jgi:hypothetical protein